MDKQYIQDNEVEIEYLRNQLTPDEVEEFEVYLMENPEMVESLELIDILREKGSFDENLAEKPTSFVSKLFNTSFLRPGFIFANLAFFTLGAFLFGGFLNPITTNQSAQIQRLEHVSSVRGANENTIAPTVELTEKSFQSAKDEFILVMTAPSDDTAFNIELLGEGSKVIEKFSEFRVNANGDIVLSLEAKSYPPGGYRVQIVSVSELKDQVFYSFPFETQMVEENL